MPSFKTRTLVKRFFCLAALFAIGLSVPLQSHLAFGDDFRHMGKVGRNEQLVSQFVWQMMECNHLSKHALDDEISQCAFDVYTKSLDPTKSYFRESDIAEFAKWKTRLDDQLKASDYTAAFQIFDRFLQRVDEQTKLAIELIDEKQDFSMDEEMTVDPDLANYPKNDAEARDLWRKRIKYNLLALRGDSDKQSEEKPVDPKEILRKRFSSFARRIHQMDSEDVIEQFITSITSSFDPHTSYLSQKSFDNFMIQMSLELDGIGATLQDGDDGFTVIKSLVTGGAAAKQGGLKVDDKVVAVAQGDENGDYADPKLGANMEPTLWTQQE